MAILFAIFIVIFIVATILINQFIILRSFKKFEEESISNKISSTEKLINNIKRNLESVCIDWAQWDDTYYFIHNKNWEYIDSNFANAEETLKTLNIDMIAFINLEGEVLYEKYYDFKKNLEKPIPSELTSKVFKKFLNQEFTNSENQDNSKSLKGFFVEDKNIFILSCNPILTSIATGPPAGILIMGLLLDDEIEEISDIINAKVELFSLDNQQNLNQYSEILKQLSNKEKIKITYSQQDSYNGFKTIEDIFSERKILLKVSGIRDIYMHGRTTAAILATTVSVTSLILVILTLFAFNRFVTRRIHDLSISIKKIGKSKDLTKRLSIEGNDEVSSIVKDINKMLDEIENSQNKIIKTQKMYQDLFENSLDGIYISRPDGQYIRANDALVKMLGYDSKEELLSVNTKDLYYYPETRPGINERTKPFNKILKKKDGSKIFVEISPRVVYEEGGEVYYQGIVRDVTQQKEFEEKIKYISFHDSLTDLYNRAYFDEELKRLKKTRQLPLTIVMGDVNGLKEINDTYGHEKGDILLRKIAKILKRCFRSDDVIARIGGDEFCIILPNTTKENAEKIVERIHKECQRRSTKAMPLSISFGIQTKDKAEIRLRDVIKEAEVFMYENKRKEKNYKKSN